MLGSKVGSAGEQPLGGKPPHPITSLYSGHLKSCFFPLRPHLDVVSQTCIHIERIGAPQVPGLGGKVASELNWSPESFGPLAS